MGTFKRAVRPTRDADPVTVTFNVPGDLDGLAKAFGGVPRVVHYAVSGRWIDCQGAIRRAWARFPKSETERAKAISAFAEKYMNSPSTRVPTVEEVVLPKGTPDHIVKALESQGVKVRITE